MDLSAHREAVAGALHELEASLTRLVAALAHERAVVTLESNTTLDSDVARVCAAYTAIDYMHEDRGGDSPICLGVVGTNTETLRRAKDVNAAKANLKTICAPLQRVMTRVPVKSDASPTKAIPVIRAVLRNIRRSDLNLLAAYRKIPLLAAPPLSVTYTRANTRAVYRKSIDEIYEMLSSFEGPAANADRERLSTLNRHETYLGLAKLRYQNIRANVRYAHLDNRGRGRIQIAAELPLLYATGRKGGSPEVTFPAEQQSARKPRVGDAKLESNAFLQSLPVYRYLER